MQCIGTAVVSPGPQGLCTKLGNQSNVLHDMFLSTTDVLLTKHPHTFVIGNPIGQGVIRAPFLWITLQFYARI